MQLPIKVKALLDEMTDIQAAREIALSVSVYITEDAAPELVAHVRNVFASSCSQVRMTVSYIGKQFVPYPTDDIAIVVAGTQATVGKVAADIRKTGVPAMVVTLAPYSLAQKTLNWGASIPDGDIVSPFGADCDTWNEEVAGTLDDRMGRWIVAACREKRLAFAVAFPFMRRSLAKDVVQLTAIQNAIVGFIPVIVGADLPIMTLNQAKMSLQIAAAYGHEIDKKRLKELGLVIAGAYVSRGLVRKLVAAVPVLGCVFKTGIAYGTTLGVGYAIIEYFEGGEDVTGVANVVEHGSKLGAKAVYFLKNCGSRIAFRKQ